MSRQLRLLRGRVLLLLLLLAVTVLLLQLACTSSISVHVPEVVPLLLFAILQLAVVAIVGPCIAVLILVLVVLPVVAIDPAVSCISSW